MTLPGGTKPAFARNLPWAGMRAMGSALGPFLGLVLVWAAFAAADQYRSKREGKPPSFHTATSLQKVLKDSSRVGVAALGMTLIIIAGGIDLSVGTAMSLSATVAAWYFRANYPVLVGIMAGLATGCLAGFLNGVLISTMRIVPFIVTLGTMMVFLGSGLILAKDTPIRAFGKVPRWIVNLQVPVPEPAWMINTSWGLRIINVSSGVWVMAALALIVALLLKYSVFGRHVFALGSNEATARLCGVPVTAVRIGVYTVAGLFVGVAGLFQFATLGGEGDPNQGIGKELPIIAAVVIGGGSLSGGRGSVLGTLSGACIMATIEHGCATLGIRTSSQKVLIGLIIMAAVVLDQYRQRRLRN
jgi:ribose transport system permease protein